MKKLLKTLLSAAVLVASAACQHSEIDELERDIDDLRSRLTALETQVELLNDNVETLQRLLSGATVNSVEQRNGVYTITLSNGETLTLTQGSEGGYYTPAVSVDEAGYWVVSFDNTTYTRIQGADGKPVQAVAQPGATGDKGDDGVTPRFRVDQAGYWLVSYDGGETFVQVLGADGKPVDATGGAVQDKFFADVKCEDSLLVITLLDGKTCEIPIVSGFKCVIAGAGELVGFALNETRTFEVEMRGVAATVVTAPEGWTASLTALEQAAETGATHTLAVTAPAAETRAAADSRTDVAILAVADNGLSTIAKLAVATNDMVLHAPTVKSVSVDAARSTETSLTFSVVTDDAKGWKYLCLPSSQPAPTVDEVFEQGAEGDTAAVTAEGLAPGTAYTIYVAAYYGSTVARTLATAEARTTRAAVDYWEQGCTIAGVTYDKHTPGAQLLTSDTQISKPGVYFLDPADGAQITLTKCTVTELVLIGRNSRTRAKIVVTLGPLSLGNGRGLILKNVELDAGAYNNYLFNFASGTVASENLILEDSKFIAAPDKHMSYFNNASGTIGNIEVVNSIVEARATGNGKAMRFINFNSGRMTGRLSFTNSVFYTDGYVTNGTLLHVNGAAQTMPDVAVSVTGCSLINYIGCPNGYFMLSNVGSVDFSKNILWSKSYKQTSFVFKFWVEEPGAALAYRDNLAYGLDEANSGCWKYFHTGADSKYRPEEGNYVKESGDPFRTMDFDTDTFEPANNAYGAQL